MFSVISLALRSRSSKEGCRNLKAIICNKDFSFNEKAVQTLFIRQDCTQLEKDQVSDKTDYLTAEEMTS